MDINAPRVKARQERVLLESAAYRERPTGRTQDIINGGAIQGRARVGRVKW
jgi:hypothetical protein